MKRKEKTAIIAAWVFVFVLFLPMILFLFGAWCNAMKDAYWFACQKWMELWK